MQVIPRKGIAVDASCFGGNGSKFRDGYFHGKTEWRGMNLETGEKVFASKVYPQGTVNIGEFCAIVDALEHLWNLKDEKTPVYSDSRIAIKWVQKRYINSTLPNNEHTAEILVRLNERLKWIWERNFFNPVIWWNARKWGEIPADFGRKQVTAEPVKVEGAMASALIEARARRNIREGGSTGSRTTTCASVRCTFPACLC